MEFVSILDLKKAYTEGIYADTPANRKLGRVGMSYKEWTQKQHNKEENNTTKKVEKDNIYSKKEFKEATLKNSSIGEDFKKEIQSLNPESKEFGETARYLVNLHASNGGTYRFIESVRSFIKDNEIEDCFEVKGEGGMYYISTKGTNKNETLLIVGASANGREIFFKEPNESNFHRIGNNSSTVNTYFKKVINKIKEKYPSLKSEIEENKNNHSKAMEGLEKIDIQGTYGSKYKGLKDKETGIILVATYGSSIDIDPKYTDIISDIQRGKENAKKLKNFAEKYDIKLYHSMSAMNMDNFSQRYYLGGITQKTQEKLFYYSPAKGRLYVYVNRGGRQPILQNYQDVNLEDSNPKGAFKELINLLDKKN